MPESSRFHYSRREFIGAALTAAAGAAVGGACSENQRYPAACGVRVMKIPAPAGWAGKKAVFLSDVHYGNFFGRKDAALLQAAVAAQNPDLILLGGDLAHTPRTDLGPSFSAWSPRCPVLFAPGNHDIRLGRADTPVMRQVAAAGVTVLCNRAERWNGLTFIGLPSALCLVQRRSLLRMPGLKLVLGHEPDVWDRYDEPDLVHLAGHTHGGQICLFGRPVRLPALGQKYRLGRFSRAGNRTLLVTAGVGCAAIPVRIDCPPEICRLEFV